MNKQYFKAGLAILTIVGMSAKMEAQKKNDFNNPGLTHYLNDEHTRYVSFSGYAELWARYTQLNPGSLINDQSKSDVSDLSLRRVRVKMTYKPTEKLMFVLQAGTTNVNMNATFWMLTQNMLLTIKLRSEQDVPPGEDYPDLPLVL